MPSSSNDSRRAVSCALSPCSILPPGNSHTPPRTAARYRHAARTSTVPSGAFRITAAIATRTGAGLGSMFVKSLEEGICNFIRDRVFRPLTDPGWTRYRPEVLRKGHFQAAWPVLLEGRNLG